MPNGKILLTRALLQSNPSPYCSIDFIPITFLILFFNSNQDYFLIIVTKTSVYWKSFINLNLMVRTETGLVSDFQFYACGRGGKGISWVTLHNFVIFFFLLETWNCIRPFIFWATNPIIWFENQDWSSRRGIVFCFQTSNG